MALSLKGLNMFGGRPQEWRPEGGYYFEEEGIDAWN
jgi:hypothetical protein